MYRLKIIIGVAYLVLLIAAITTQDWKFLVLVLLIILDNIIYNLERKS